MKKWQKKLIGFTGLCAALALLCSAVDADKSTSGNSGKPLKVGVVSFKSCVEQSKIGKQEQAGFESLKKQMESVLAEKEKTLNDMSAKFNDADYLDSLSPEAETELKRKFRALNQEISQQQNQYMQTLQQTNFKVVQKLQDMVTKAANEVAKKDNLDIVLNEESCFFCVPNIDISTKIISMMDEEYKKNPNGPDANK